MKFIIVLVEDGTERTLSFEKKSDATDFIASFIKKHNSSDFYVKNVFYGYEFEYDINAKLKEKV